MVELQKTEAPEERCFYLLGEKRCAGTAVLHHHGEDGFPIQEFTVHISEPIYPDKSLPYRKQVDKLRSDNYEVWKEIYEREYQMPLEYTTIDMPDLDSLK